MKLQELSFEVLSTSEALVTLARENVDEIKRRALSSPRRRARICTHQTVDAAVHEMLIAIARGCYIRPHRHVGKSESFHVIEGELDIVLFDDNGVVEHVVTLGDAGSTKPFYYRNEARAYHTVIVRSAVVVFHESTSGPLVAGDTIPAPWSPAEEDAAAVAAFMTRLQDAAGA